MLIPSIDLMGGRAVQLRQGRELVMDLGDPRPLAEQLAPLGEVAVIDLDAAMGTGSNEALVRELLAMARCRVGGGIRSVEAARRWLDLGARKVILGTAARPEVLRELPRERVIAAVDSWAGGVVVEGWKKPAGEPALERISRLAPLVGGFLVTFVEIEGTMGGWDMSRVGPVIDAAAGARVTFAGGITTAGQIGELDRAGADAQVGMAIHNGTLDPADAVAALLRTDRSDGLWPTVVVDEGGRALGLVYSSAESLRQAVRTRRGVYHSRSRGGVWIKGQTSGDTQRLLAVDVDCDRDALRFTVRQEGAGFCHAGTRTCWGPAVGLAALEATLSRRAASPEPGSYTARLLSDPALLRAKLMEEAGELAEARGAAHAADEAADLFYFALVRCVSAGVSLADVERRLDERSLKLTRRAGDAKPGAVS